MSFMFIISVKLRIISKKQLKNRLNPYIESCFVQVKGVNKAKF